MMLSSSRMKAKTLTAMFALMVGMLMLVRPASADFINGDQLRVYCTSANPNDDAICVVYITGAFDAFTTVDLIAEKTNGAERIFCPVEGVGPDKLKDITLAWMNRPEANLDYAATLLVWGAMKDAFGCDKG